MKKIILFLLLGTLSLSYIRANEIKTYIPIYKQTQTTKTIFPNLLLQNNKWIKTDSVNVIFDFIENNKIIVNDNNYKSIYKIKSKRLVKYDNVDQYIIKAVDSKNNNHNIELLYYNTNIALFTIVNDSNIERYILNNNSIKLKK
jgi:hypothetical protein